MKQNDRVEALQAVYEAFLAKAKDGGYVVLDTVGDHDQYVQVMLRDGRLIGEVGSRLWREPERPLSSDAVAGLVSLGFSGGGPEKNFAKENLSPSASELAQLTDRLFRTAYELDDEYSFVVHYLVFNDVSMPRTQRFSRDMIERHLRANDVKFLRDDDGDFRADFFSDGMEGPVLIWLCATGGDDTTYHVGSFAPQGPRPESREDALRRCNEWNNDHLWPKTFVRGDKDGWDVVTAFDVNLAAGVTQEQLDTLTRDAVSASLDFWGWLGTTQESAPPKRQQRR